VEIHLVLALGFDPRVLLVQELLDRDPILGTALVDGYGR
jgi:hypothetical protein